jgi:hypothetical protein
MTAARATGLLFQGFRRAQASPALHLLGERLRLLRSDLGFLALVVFVFTAYWFLLSAGTHPWPVYGTFHDLQADGFLKGQLNLTLDPAPELVQAKDPYDRANGRYWVFDASYYKGKYFIYWGPVPALLQAAAKGLLQIRRPIGDGNLMLFFLCFAFLAGALVIRRLARRLFPGLPRWLVGLGLLAFAFANSTVHCATSAGTYQVAIVGAQAWLLAGLVFAFEAVWHAGTPRAGNWRLLVAGTCWALAIGSRLTVAFAVALLILITAWTEASESERRFRRAFFVLLLLGVPVALGSFGLLFYNYLRFDNWLEFGSKIQLSGHPTLRIEAAFIPLNILSYSLRPWVTSCEFPYLFQQWNVRPDFPDWLMPVPKSYFSPEPVVGFLVALPITWLIPLAFVFAPRPRAPVTRGKRTRLFCLLSFATIASVTGAIGLGVYGSTMRYLSDITFGLVLLSLLAGFGLRMHPLAAHAPRTISLLVGLLATATIVIGLLIGYQGYNGHFRHFNPKLHAKLDKALSFCSKTEPEQRMREVVEPSGYRPRK